MRHKWFHTFGITTNAVSPSLLSLSAKFIVTMYNICRNLYFFLSMNFKHLLHTGNCSSFLLSYPWSLLAQVLPVLQVIHLLLYIDQEERFKGPKGTNPLWTLIAANYQGHIPWTYSGRRTDVESTAENVMNKAYRAFWTCKGTFGKTWGLKPRVVHWIYTMVIRPALTCGSTVWWPWVRYNVSRTELS